MPTLIEIVPVESQTLPDHVYERLRHAIHLGHLKPGQRLIDGELAKALHVSRATVREALRMLESRGLVDIRHRRGAFVAELTRMTCATHVISASCSRHTPRPSARAAPRRRNSRPSKS